MVLVFSKIQRAILSLPFFSNNSLLNMTLFNNVNDSIPANINSAHEFPFWMVVFHSYKVNSNFILHSGGYKCRRSRRMNVKQVLK